MKDWLSTFVAGGEKAPATQDLSLPQAELGGRLDKIRKQLQALAGGQKAPAGVQTIADDGGKMTPAKAAMIGRDEVLVRGVLELFELDYDGLVMMDGKSAYSQAVKAQPELTKRVLASDQPVLEALKIALGFKPFAEFAEKYGRTPDDIKAAMQREVQAEMAKQTASKLGNPTKAAKVEAPLFSAPAVGQRLVSAGKRKGGLKEVFGR